jgi:plastocyanin
VIVLALAGCTGSPPAPSPAGTPAATLHIAARDSRFDTATLGAPAGLPFAIEFDNRDSIPHNVALPGGPPGTSGEVFSGPAVRTYLFPPLPAGSYPFRCDVHPEMTGTLAVQ